MKKGRTRFNERVGIFLNTEREIRDLARHMRLPDTEAYAIGVNTYALEHPDKITEQQLNKSIQFDRERLKEMQDRIAMKERVALDLRIRDQVRKKKVVEIRYDERNRPYEVVIAQ
jgi:hypothetical protein